MRPLLVIGSAPCVFADLEDLDRITAPDRFDLMAVGLSTVRDVQLRYDYVANNHPENGPAIRQLLASGDNEAARVIGPLPGPGVDIVEPYRPPTGSSAITGVLAAIRMGYRKIVLCGCPLTGNAPAGNPYEEFRAGWQAKRSELFGIVKSLSGWTQELLGAPTEAWLSKKCEIFRTGLKINREVWSRWEYLIELARGYNWRRGAELGVWYGKTYYNLLAALPDLHLIGVDAWIACDKSEHHRDQAANRAEVYRRREDYADRALLLDMTTDAAARIVTDRSLDFVFIDAAHDYASVREDIDNWRPKLKSGGFLTGHDYDWPTVAAAVHDSLDAVHIHNAGGDHMWAWRQT